jgi:hypothetical protein
VLDIVKHQQAHEKNYGSCNSISVVVVLVLASSGVLISFSPPYQLVPGLSAHSVIDRDGVLQMCE